MGILIILSFIALIYIRGFFILLVEPYLTRSNRHRSFMQKIVAPILHARHLIQTSTLNIKRDGFSLLKLYVLSLILSGVASMNAANVTSISEAFIVMYLAYLIIDLIQERIIPSENRSSPDNLMVAVVMLSCVAVVIALIVGYGSIEQGIASQLGVKFYSLVVLVSGLIIRNSVIPQRQSQHFYQLIEQEFARFTWVSIFIASFNPGELSELSGFCFFLSKLLVIEMSFQILNRFVPTLDTRLRWQFIYKFIVPISLVCVYGVFMSLIYVG